MSQAAKKQTCCKRLYVYLILIYATGLVDNILILYFLNLPANAFNTPR